jgi:hypothetical protein
MRYTQRKSKISRRIAELAPWKVSPSKLSLKQIRFLKANMLKSVYPKWWTFQKKNKSSKNKEQAFFLERADPTKNDQLLLLKKGPFFDNGCLLKEAACSSLLKKLQDSKLFEQRSMQFFYYRNLIQETALYDYDKQFKKHQAPEIVSDITKKNAVLTSSPKKRDLEKTEVKAFFRRRIYGLSSYLKNGPFGQKSSGKQKQFFFGGPYNSLIRGGLGKGTATQIVNCRRSWLFFGSKPGYFYKTANKWKQFVLLEIKLLSVIIRAFRLTLYTANQLISHKKIQVNGITVSVNGLILQYGDIFKLAKKNGKKAAQQADIISEKSKIANSCFHQKVNWSYSSFVSFQPVHLEVNYKTMEGVVLYEPKIISFPYNIDLDF